VDAGPSGVKVSRYARGLFEGSGMQLCAYAHGVEFEGAAVTNSDWWDRAKTPPKPETVPIRPRDRVCTLRKDQHGDARDTRSHWRLEGIDPFDSHALATDESVQAERAIT
jgi:hypothetical protein